MPDDKRPRGPAAAALGGSTGWGAVLNSEIAQTFQLTNFCNGPQAAVQESTCDARRSLLARICHTIFSEARGFVKLFVCRLRPSAAVASE